MLQWGRNLTVAEGEGKDNLDHLILVLQWGRNLTVAEGARGLTTPMPFFRFNGAAT